MWNLSDCRRAVADNARRIWGKYLALIILKLIFSRFLYCPKARKKGVSFGQIFSENRNTHFGKSTHSELQIRQRESTHGKFMDFHNSLRPSLVISEFQWSKKNSRSGICRGSRAWWKLCFTLWCLWRLKLPFYSVFLLNEQLPVI